MPNIRIKDIPTTASATSSTDFIAIDGATNGTRKLSADSPVFSGNVTVNGGTVGTAASTNLTLAGGSSGASLVLGQGANGNVTANALGTGYFRLVNAANTQLHLGPGGGSPAIFIQPNLAGTAIYAALTGTAQRWAFADDAQLTNIVERARLTSTGNLLIGGTTDITGSGGLKVFGTTASTSTTTGALQVAGGVGVAGAVWSGGFVSSTTATGLNLTGSNASIEIGAVGATNTPYIDFHSSASSTDYDTRLIASSGTSGNGAGVLTILTGTLASAAGITFTNTTASTSTTTGALQVAGGVGVAGAAFIGGGVQITGSDVASVALYILGDRAIRTSTPGNVFIDTKTTDGGSIKFRPRAIDGITIDGSTQNTTVHQSLTVSGTQNVFGLPSSASALGTNSTMTFERTNDTTLTIKVRGSDGTTRSVALTLA
jgi:hypothetical protein